MLTVTTRPAEPDDLPTLLTMVHALAAHHGDTATLTAEHLSRDVFGPDRWIRVIVAQCDDSLVGYAALCPLIRLQFGRRGMDMHHIFVAQGQRGRGIGRALIAASINAARDARCAYLMVGTDPDNHAAQQMYRAAGFESVPAPGPRFGLRLSVPDDA